MRRLFPDPTDEVDLAEVYADLPVAVGRPGVFVNMIASVDGATAMDGVSGPLGGPADRAVFRLLRTLTDVVLVGAATARAEGYRPARADEATVQARRERGQTDVPAIAVVSRGLELDWDAPLFTEPITPTVLVTCDAAPEAALDRARQRCRVIAAGGADVDLAAALAQLGRDGARHVLCEGGPRLNAALAQAGLIDELCLTIAPRMAGGDAARILNGPLLADPPALGLRSLLEDEGFLLARYRVVG